MENSEIRQFGRRDFVRSGVAVLATLSSGVYAAECEAENNRSDAEGKEESPQGSPQTAGGEKPAFRALKEDDRVNLDKEAKQIIEKAYKLGYDFEKKHGGCARCTMAALQKSVEFAPEDQGLFRATSCLDGGATPHGVQNCGGFTGAGMFIGWVCGTEGFKNTDLSHKLIRRVYEKYEKHYGSVLCKDVKKKAGDDCPKVVARAAQWAAETLLAQFADYEAPDDDEDFV
ncbi:MAG: C_GCAxxG_C_C family protein [Sedimentisphaerales bacterium]|nr:C_GCAxxG_C_C family protein [Sedimentisphaerales bacterium]